jgi:hypothetical protein
MGPANQLEARRALAADLNQQFNNSGGQQNIARQILDASQQRNIGNAPPAVQARLKVLFGNDDNYTKFMEHAGLEHQMAAAKSSYVGSDTYKNLKAATAEPIAMAMHGTGQTFAPSASNMIQSTLRRTGVKWVLNKMNEGAANEMHDVLNTPGADAVERLLRGLSPGTNPLVGAGSTVGAPAAISAGAASLKKHFAQF